MAIHNNASNLQHVCRLITMLAVLLGSANASAQSLGSLTPKTPLQKNGRYNEEYQYVKISPDGKFVVGLTSFSRLSVWRISDREEVFSRQFDRRTPKVAWAARGQQPKALLAITYEDRDGTERRDQRFAQVISFPEGTVLNKFQLPEKLYHDMITLSADGAHLAIGKSTESEGDVWIYDVADGTTSVTFRPFDYQLKTIALLPGQPLLAAGGADRNSGATLKLWNFLTGEEFAASQWQKEAVVGIAASSDGQRVAAVSGDKTLKVFGVDPGPLKVLDNYTRGANASRCFRYTNNDARLWFASGRRFILWDADSRQQIHYQDLAEFESMDVSPDGRLAVICGRAYGTSPVVLDCETILRYLDPAKSQKVFDERGKIGNITISADNQQLMLKRYFDGLALWDVSTQRQVDWLDFKIDGKDTNKDSVTVAPDMGVIFQLKYDPMMRRRPSGQATNESLLRLPENEDVRYSAVSSNGEYFAFGTDKDRTLVFDRSFKLLNTVDIDRGRSLAISADGRWLGCAFQFETKVFDLKSNTELGTWDRRAIVGFSADNRYLFGRKASHDDPELWKLDLESGTISTDYPLQLRGYGPSSMQLSSKSPYFITARGTEVRVFNYQTGRLLGGLRGNNKKVLSVAMASDGKTAYSGDEEGNLLTWDLSDWIVQDEQLREPHTDPVAAKDEIPAWSTVPKVYSTKNGIRITIEPTAETDQIDVQNSLREVLRQVQAE